MKLDRKFFKKMSYVLLAAFAAGLIFVSLVNFTVKETGEGMIYSVETAAQKQLALVLGAKVHENGRLSDMFRDRVETAISLYEAGKVGKILVSGDHGQENYDEVNAAKDYLLDRGVAGEDIFLDHAGFDTYDSIYRARDVFQAKSVIIVTQAYHMPRALYIAEKLGVDAAGVSADLTQYGGQEARDFREKFAVVKAWLDVVLRSEPTYLGEPVPISGPSSASWD
jgi:vancomycin permeability regulator SanA